MRKVAEIRQYTNRKIFASLVAVVFIAVGTTLAAVFTILNLLHINAESRGIRDRQFLLDSTYLTLREIESGQRGFLLTGDEQYLTVYNEALGRLPSQVQRLSLATKDFPEHADIDKLLPLIDSKVNEMRSSVDLRRQGQVDAALAIVVTGQGQALVDQIMALRTTVDQKEAQWLDVKRQLSSQTGRNALYIVVVAAVMTTLLAPAIYYLYVKAIASERELDQAKDEFVSLASHQLRTPATGIKSILSMVVDGDFGPLNASQNRVLRKALQSNEREIGIIEELLNVAKADAGRLVLRPAELDMGNLIETIVSEQGPAIKAKQLELRYKAPLAPVTMVGDEEKLYMAIGNLIDNARKYTPADGHIDVFIRGRKSVVEVEVADSGEGIDEGDLARVFDRFHRARGVLSGSIEGTGLGLYLARRIVELHNGTIEVNSKKGHGSRFVMTLPLRRV